MAVDAGADAVGFIFADSPRKIAVRAAVDIARNVPVPLNVGVVGVVADTPEGDVLAAGSTLPRLTLQFHGTELPDFCARASMGRDYIKVFHLKPDETYEQADFDALRAYEGATPMFDSRVGEQIGGTGVPFAWEILRGYKGKPFIISGGLTPENVGDCVRMLRPYAVDVRSGVETNGMKDPHKVRAFIAAVRAADASA